ncbi:hypothetical protein [Zoogloea sp.]
MHAKFREGPDSFDPSRRRRTGPMSPPDLNLLITLDALLAEGSVRGACA